MQKIIFEIGVKKFLWFKNLKTLCREHMLLVITVGTFYEKEMQKANQNELRVEKLIKKKDDNLYVKDTVKAYFYQRHTLF